MAISGYERMGWLRASVGVALVVAPRLPMRVSGREVPTGSTALLMRTIGIRDLVLGLGTVAASRTPGTTDERRWTTAALASDALDTVVSLASSRSIGKRDAVGAALLALGFALADVVVLRAEAPDPVAP